MSEYFTKEINLKKIGELSDYLVNNQGFEPQYEEKMSKFASQFNPNEWRNKKIGIQVNMYLNSKGAIYIKTYDSERDLEKFQFDKKIQSDLVKKVMEIVEIENIFYLGEKPVKFN
jgi:hypothetical protein